MVEKFGRVIGTIVGIAVTLIIFVVIIALGFKLVEWIISW